MWVTKIRLRPLNCLWSQRDLISDQRQKSIDTSQREGVMEGGGHSNRCRQAYSTVKLLWGFEGLCQYWCLLDCSYWWAIFKSVMNIIFYVLVWFKKRTVLETAVSKTISTQCPLIRLFRSFQPYHTVLISWLRIKLFSQLLFPRSRITC